MVWCGGVVWCGVRSKQGRVKRKTRSTVLSKCTVQGCVVVFFSLREQNDKTSTVINLLNRTPTRILLSLDIGDVNRSKQGRVKRKTRSTVLSKCLIQGCVVFFFSLRE